MKSGATGSKISRWIRQGERHPSPLAGIVILIQHIMTDCLKTQEPLFEKKTSKFSKLGLPVRALQWLGGGNKSQKITPAKESEGEEKTELCCYRCSTMQEFSGNGKQWDCNNCSAVNKVIPGSPQGESANTCFCNHCGTENVMPKNLCRRSFVCGKCKKTSLALSGKKPKEEQQEIMRKRRNRLSLLTQPATRHSVFNRSSAFNDTLVHEFSAPDSRLSKRRHSIA